jgi:hypothetical protein
MDKGPNKEPGQKKKVPTIRPKIERADLSAEEKKKIYTRNYRKLNPEKVKLWNKNHYLKNREKIIRHNIEYRKNRNNPDPQNT